MMMMTFSATDNQDNETLSFCFISPAQMDLVPGRYYTLKELSEKSKVPVKVISTRVVIESKIGTLCRVVTQENLRPEGKHHKFSANLLETYGEFLSAIYLRMPL